ncbi:restriction endonuclease subunit S [Candidatus Absconditicoccus praedator]|uniref:restriction endonuclease subunit S n=1 Tax=Candidatus Absconditicoccus praedator TaxID=2735562 RepID=UPI001E338EA8|nr:restriction endonuclease subunit S [Candidatus Absconditicoccus praedator]UFX83389.1 restriction endonuclease subunit S [Candidatus Absconditicoccus praedator]
MQTVKLGDIGKIVTGSTPSTKVPEYYGDEYLRVCPKDLDQGIYVFDTEKKLSSMGFEKMKSKHIPAGSVMVGCIGNIGKCAIATEKTCTNQQINSIIPDENKVYNKYLYFSIKFYEQLFQTRSTSTVVSILNKKSFSNLEIPLPDLSTQKAIADKLEKIENLIEMKKQVISKTDELTKSIFIDMFGDPYLNPKGWEIKRIKDLVTSVNYGTSKKAFEEKTQGSYEILRMNNITYSGNINLESMKYINLDTEEEKRKYLLEKGDVLFNRTNSKELVGKTAVYDLDMPRAFAGYLIRIKVDKEKILPIFLSTFLNSDYGKKVLFTMAKSIVGMANINAKEVQSIKIYLPPLELQQEFANKIQQIEAKKQLHQQSLEKLQELYSSQMQESFRF